MLRTIPIVIALSALFLAGCGQDDSAAPIEVDDGARIIALGGASAEAVYALGAGDLLVAREESSVHPAEILELPSIGYYRQVAAEGVLSMNPTLVLAEPHAGPETALQQIETAGVPVVRLPGGPSIADVEAQVRAVAAALEREERGEDVIDAMQARLAEAEQIVAEADRRPRALFVLGQAGGATLSMAGRGTNADEFIRLAGAENAFAEVEGYRPMNAEALADAVPDVVFMLGLTAGRHGGAEAFADRVELRASGGEPVRVIVLPDAALNFGPSVGEFVLDFARQLHEPTSVDY